MADNEEVDDFLAHYGVKGMKWGVRKDRNPNYSDTQVKRDRQIYGKRGVKRVNRAMNDGDSISTARSIEKTRRDRVMARNPYARQAGKVGGAVAGVIATNVGISAIKGVAYSNKTLKFVGNLLKNAPMGVKTGATNAILGARTVASILDVPELRLIASAGAASVGAKLSGDIGVGINMRSHGYDPNRK